MKNKKYITSELIEAKMSAKGFDEQESHDSDYVRIQVLKAHESEISTDWKEGMDLYQYEESTNDGYSVYVSTYDTRNVQVNENINYYVDGLAEDLKQAIIDSSEIYVDDLYQDYIDDVFQELYIDLSLRTETICVDELLDEGYEEAELQS